MGSIHFTKCLSLFRHCVTHLILRLCERVGCLCRLLAESGSGLGEQVSLLHNGLFKISDTREKVEAMSVELKDAKKYVLDTM